MEQPKVSITPVQQMMASCSGAMLTSLLVTPMDVVKIRLQAQIQPITSGTCFLYCNGLMDHLQVCPNGCQADTSDCMHRPPAKPYWYRRPGHFTGTLDALVTITRTEGIMSLWSGLPPTLMMAVPATVFYFTVYDQLKYALGYREGDPTTQHVPVFAGSAARIGTSSLISPLELVRTKIQSEQLSYRQVGRAVRDTVSHSGVLSLWRGLGPTLLRDVPFSAIYWYGYELCKSKQMEAAGNRRLTFQQSFISGAVAGTVAGVITLPFDVVKTHRQMTLGQQTSLTAKVSTWKILSELYGRGGIAALFTGLVPRIMRITPSCAIMISSYEFFKQFFAEYNTKWDEHSDAGQRAES